MARQLKNEKALFEEIFDGPDSMFGRIFGQRGSKIKASPSEPVVRVKVSKAQLAILVTGKSLNFKSEKGYILLEPSGQ
jgi:hypothetical protein